MPLDIAQIGSSLHDWGGIERYVAYLSEGLAARGHSASVVCPPGSPLDRRVSQERIPIELGGQFRFDQLPRFLRLFRRRFDVVHVHFSPDFIVPAVAARMRKQPLVIMTRHLVLRWSRSKVRRYSKLFHHFIAVSDAAARAMASSGLDPQRISVAKAGCPPIPSPAVEPRDGPLRVGYFGRLVPEKGVHILLEAAKMCGDTARVRIFGAGPFETELRQAAPGNVTFMGFTEDVGTGLAEVDAVVVPSLWEEAFPFSVLEAMAAGRATLLSSVGGLPEMVEPESTGLLVPAGDAQALAGAISRLAGDREAAASMGRRARELYESTYTVAHMAERIEGVYTSLR